jgi:hypothetical protein
MRGRTSRVLTTGIDELGPSARLRSEDTPPAEMLGMMHLVQVQHETSSMTAHRRTWPRPNESPRGSER